MLFAVALLSVCRLSSYAGDLYETPEQCDAALQQMSIDVYEQKNPIETVRKLENTIEEAHRKKWLSREVLGLNIMGIQACQSRDYYTAVVLFTRTYELACSNSQEDFLPYVLSNMGMVYFLSEDYRQALDYYIKAYELGSRNEENKWIPYYELNVSEAAIKLGERKTAMEFLQKAENSIGGAGGHVKAEWWREKSALSMLEGDFAGAISAGKKAIELSALKRNAENNETLARAALKVGEAYIKKHDWNQAREYIRMAIRHHREAGFLTECYDRYADLERQKRNLNAALQMKDSALVMKDSFIRQTANPMLEVSKARFDAGYYRHEVEERDFRITLLKRYWGIVCGVLVLFVTLLVWVWRSHSKRLEGERRLEQANRVLAEHQRELIEQRLKEQEARMKLEKQQLTQELELRNRELAARVLYNAGRDKVMQEITESNSPDEIKKQVEWMKRNMNPDQEWEEFMHLFEQTNNNLLIKLKQNNPILTASDLRFVAYVYMNMSNKEISALFNITLDAVRKRKERIGKKINLPAGTSLYDYLFNLDS